MEAIGRVTDNFKIKTASGRDLGNGTCCYYLKVLH